MSGGPPLHVSTSAIEPGYFHTMGIGMIAGRDFTSIDLPHESSTIVVTESLAKRWVIAYRVSLRTQEIGVRMALGAGRDAIFRDVLLHGLAIAVAGVVIAEVLAIPASRALASVQASIRPAALSAHVAAAVIWVALALLACYVPASRASRVDPMKALRQE